MSSGVTTPPPPPEEPLEPTLVRPAGDRRVVVDEEEPPPPVVRPYPWWLWLLVVLFLAAAILFLVLWLMERNDNDTRNVPSVVGLSLVQAQDKASQRGFTLKSVRRPAGPPAGTVVDQAPQPGADLEKGAQVMAVVSAGQQQVTVP